MQIDKNTPIAKHSLKKPEDWALYLSKLGGYSLHFDPNDEKTSVLKALSLGLAYKKTLKRSRE